MYVVFSHTSMIIWVILFNLISQPPTSVILNQTFLISLFSSLTPYIVLTSSVLISTPTSFYRPCLYFKRISLYTITFLFLIPPTWLSLFYLPYNFSFLSSLLFVLLYHTFSLQDTHSFSRLPHLSFLFFFLLLSHTNFFMRDNFFL